MARPMDTTQVHIFDIDDISLEKLIGRGNFPVYRGTVAGDAAAVKKMDINKHQPPREVEVHSSLLPHPNILPLLGITYSKDGFTVYICMELADKSLYDYLHKEKAKPSLHQSRGWATQIARGMLHLHQHGLAHRDLKSANVLLFEKEDITKLCDFGSARPLEHSATVTGMAGTIRWMAPESNNTASTKINQRCDVFSYAMVLYEIFTHQVPFSDIREDVDVVSSIRKGERPSLPPDLPPYIAMLIHSCWKHEAQDRPTFEAILQCLATSSTSKEGTQDNLVGCSSLHKAAESGDADAVQQMIKAGVSVNSHAAKDGKTALHLASQHGHASVIQVLLSGNADINLQDKVGRTALYYASWRGHTSVILLLLQKHADVSISKANGISPLYVSSQKGYTEMVNTLLKNGADPNQATKNGVTPLYVASEFGHTEVVDALLKNGAAPNLTTRSIGSVPLGVAAQRGQLRTARRLLESEANINYQNKRGASPLYMASQEGHTAMVDTLLKRGADPNLATVDGTTALFISSQEGHVEVVRLLLQSGAVDTPRQAGNTAVDIACAEGHTQIAHLFQQYRQRFSH